MSTLRRRGVRVDLGSMTGSGSSRMDAGVQDALARAAEVAGVPARRMASGGGPMKVTPRSVMARAKSVFSEKKP